MNFSDVHIAVNSLSSLTDSNYTFIKHAPIESNVWYMDLPRESNIVTTIHVKIMKGTGTTMIRKDKVPSFFDYDMDKDRMDGIAAGQYYTWILNEHDSWVGGRWYIAVANVYSYQDLVYSISYSNSIIIFFC